MEHSYLCTKCGNIKYDLFDEVKKCPYCGGVVVNLSFTLDEQGKMTNDEKDQVRFAYQTMEKYDKFAWKQRLIKDQKLHEDNAQIYDEARTSHPECPYCHNRNTKKITTASKALNTGMFGLFGTKRNYQWHCNNCNSNF